MDFSTILLQAFKTLFLGTLVVITCLYGDSVLLAIPAKQHWKRAVTDSATHGLVGVLSWLMVRGAALTRRHLLEALLCGLLTSAIDLDHFWAARSFALKDALNLPTRPPLHNTSFVVSICFTVWVITRLIEVYFQVTALYVLPWMCLVAWFTHHTRDAHRRGFWLYPFGSTPPLPKWAYIAVILLTGVFVMFVIHRINASAKKVALGVNTQELKNAPSGEKNGHMMEV